MASSTTEAFRRWNACGKKKTFYTKSSAKNARVRRKKVYGGTQRIYECPYCACFHITTKPELLKNNGGDTK